MKLDRNLNTDGKGKYALVKMRLLETVSGDQPLESYTFPKQAIDFGDSPDTEFFVIRLKDRYAAPALFAYANAAEDDDQKYADEIRGLAMRAKQHPHKQKPD